MESKNKPQPQKENCPNCGKKGFGEKKNCFLEGKTHYCKYCDMEFEKTVNKGEQVWKGDVPCFY